jgi:hypothetical protein
LSWSELVLGLLHNDGVVVAIGDEELVVDDHLGASLADLMQAWRRGLGAGGSCPVEGWMQEVVSGRWRARCTSAASVGEIWASGGHPVEGWVASGQQVEEKARRHAMDTNLGGMQLRPRRRRAKVGRRRGEKF